MKIFRHLADVPEACKGAVIAIGNFDGLHRGHQMLIHRAAHLAEAQHVPLAVMVFEPTPQEYFQPGMAPFRLTPFHAKARQLADLGVDILFALPFDAALAHQSAQDFVLHTLIRDLHVQAVVVGADFQFGAGRAGSAAMLAYMGEMEGFATEIVPPVMAENLTDEAGEAVKISSSAIRKAVAAGDTDSAARWLGHPFTIEGIVEHGDARGRTLGFPTANIGLDGYVRPAFGVYATRVLLFDGDKPVQRLMGVANIGIRPMYKTEQPLLEVFLFGFDADIYGQHLTVDLIRHLRPEMKFGSVALLVEQMTRDKANARAVLDQSGVA